MATTSMSIMMQKVLRNTLTDILSNEVAEEIKTIESQKVQEQVYGTYSPTFYRRRGTGGGLADVANMVTYMEDMEIAVKNETPFNNAYDYNQMGGYRPFIPPPNMGKGLAMLVEGGQGSGGHAYNYPYREEFLVPRPFTQETIDELKHGTLKKIFVNALRERGFDAK